MNDNFPCKCGHPLKQHCLNDNETEGWCRIKYDSGVACHWHVIEGDNLKFLEELSSER